MSRIKFPNSRRGVKVNGYGGAVRERDKAIRQLEAEARNESWRKLSISEQIEKLDERLGVGRRAEKQRNRLTRLAIKNLSKSV